MNGVTLGAGEGRVELRPDAATNAIARVSLQAAA